MINGKREEEKTQAGHNLTVEEVRIIAYSRIAASQEVEALLAIIDRLTGTEWRVN